MRRIKIKPAKGLLIRGENGQRLPEEGAEVLESSYWIRRIASRDVEFLGEVTDAELQKRYDKEAKEAEVSAKKAEPEPKKTKGGE